MCKEQLERTLMREKGNEKRRIRVINSANYISSVT